LVQAVVVAVDLTLARPKVVDQAAAAAALES
jgi:hypothetical protein